MGHDGEVAVIFDMDGVLVDSAAPHLQSWQKLAEQCGTTVTQEQFASTFGRQNNDIIPLLFGDVSVVEMQRLGDRKEEIYRGLVCGRCPVVEGAVKLVRDLHASGVRLAVGSSGPLANIELVLGEMNVVDCFAVVVSADDVTRGKPDPQVFQLAAERLAVLPARCVVVEDAPSGVQAARAAGARAAAVMMHHTYEALQQADLVVKRLTDLTVDRLRNLVTNRD